MGAAEAGGGSSGSEEACPAPCQCPAGWAPPPQKEGSGLSLACPGSLCAPHTPPTLTPASQTHWGAGPPRWGHRAARAGPARLAPWPPQLRLEPSLAPLLPGPVPEPGGCGCPGVDGPSCALLAQPPRPGCAGRWALLLLRTAVGGFAELSELQSRVGSPRLSSGGWAALSCPGCGSASDSVDSESQGRRPGGGAGGIESPSRCPGCSCPAL